MDKIFHFSVILKIHGNILKAALSLIPNECIFNEKETQAKKKQNFLKGFQSAQYITGWAVHV